MDSDASSVAVCAHQMRRKFLCLNSAIDLSSPALMKLTKGSANKSRCDKAAYVDINPDAAEAYLKAAIETDDTALIASTLDDIVETMGMNMADGKAGLSRSRCPTHPGKLLREYVVPALKKTETEIARTSVFHHSICKTFCLSECLSAAKLQLVLTNNSAMARIFGLGCKLPTMNGRLLARLAHPNPRNILRLGMVN